MTKNDYIKVSGRVVLASNATFYIEQKVEIETPTEEEIKAEFPEYQFEAVAESKEDAPVDQTEEATADAPKPKRKYTRKQNN